jgi:sulfoxide reductase heme-binding subunit YedZ
MTTGDPSQQVFWLASRALGIVALVLLAISVALGLAMSGRLARRPGLPAKLKRLHEASTLVALGLIVAHAGVLLADGWLRPGIAGITLPFQLGYRPMWTGIGIIAGWLALILGLSFYVRKWIGTKTWRWLHRWTLAVYVLALGHAVGAGTDGRSTWMLAILTLLTAPIVFALAFRMLPAGAHRPRRAAHPRNDPGPLWMPSPAPGVTLTRTSAVAPATAGRDRQCRGHRPPGAFIARQMIDLAVILNEPRPSRLVRPAKPTPASVPDRSAASGNCGCERSGRCLGSSDEHDAAAARGGPDRARARRAVDPC